MLVGPVASNPLRLPEQFTATRLIPRPLATAPTAEVSRLGQLIWLDVLAPTTHALQRVDTRVTAPRNHRNDGVKLVAPEPTAFVDWDPRLTARREVAAAKRSGNTLALAETRKKVHAAKAALGERGPT